MAIKFYELVFQKLLKEKDISFESEYKFHPTRKWRFDFADIENKIAWEIEGGIWTRGRHQRPTGFMNDCEKYNEAALLGWKVLRIPTEWLRTDLGKVEKCLVTK